MSSSASNITGTAPPPTREGEDDEDVAGNGGDNDVEQQQKQQDLNEHRRKMNQKEMKAGRLSTTSLNFEIPSNEGAQSHAHRHHGRDSWRYRVLRVIHSPAVQMGLLGMLLLDVLILFAEISLLAAYPNCTVIERDAISCCPATTNTSSIAEGEQGNQDGFRRLLHRFLATDHSDKVEDDHGICEHGLEAMPPETVPAGCDPHKWQNVHNAEYAMFILTMTILAAMFLELNLAMIALKPQIFFRQIFYALDYVVISVSLALEATFHALGDDFFQSLAGLLVFFRLWRFVRIAHGIVELTAELSHQQYQALLAYAEGE